MLPTLILAFSVALSTYSVLETHAAQQTNPEEPTIPNYASIQAVERPKSNDFFHIKRASISHKHTFYTLHPHSPSTTQTTKKHNPTEGYAHSKGSPVVYRLKTPSFEENESTYQQFYGILQFEGSQRIYDANKLYKGSFYTITRRKSDGSLEKHIEVPDRDVYPVQWADNAPVKFTNPNWARNVNSLLRKKTGQAAHVQLGLKGSHAQI